MAKPPARKTKAKAEPKPKLTDKERYERFLDVARKVEASDDPKDFEEAFKKVVKPIKRG
jgi:hypothetical protein